MCSDGNMVEPSDVSEFAGVHKSLSIERHVKDGKWYLAPASWLDARRDRLVGPYDTSEEARTAANLMRMLREGPDWFKATEFFRQ